MARRLIDLTEGLEVTVDKADTAGGIEIGGLTADSRQVGPGDLFAALPGSKADGRDFIDQAIEMGAAAILAPEGTRLKKQSRTVGLVTAREPRAVLARMAARFFDEQPRHIAAVTGTSGKTSVADFTRQLWELTGERAASLGTLGLIPKTAARKAPPYLTTPDPVALHACLAEISLSGYDHLAIEASSHGLDQHRLDGLKVEAAAFTNLSQDHLDYHKDMESYFRSKLRLFAELLQPGGTAVLNADVPEYAALAESCRAHGQKVHSYGLRGRALKLLAVRPLSHGIALEMEIDGRRSEAELALIGAYQGHNALAALGLAQATESDIDALLAALPKLKGVPGRLELVASSPKGAGVFVDYAHKPGALEAAIAALRPHTDGKLICVFGAGGDRDRGKRPQMGEIATRLADSVIVTDDNPRSESPAAIRAEIMAAAPGAREIGDRAEAIAAALEEAGQGDLVLIAGKGHETGQIVGDQVIPFDDAEVARRLCGGGME
ncbi:MAG: UDP-N-acetylmuramoyl-L-alanyl-D-glutamate--2,6-diaminopimelate ligase [Limibacillus sp.]|jgi:UDP-N-acetylmuramoyl-L-alanyl-D-glutamate--2,6-diaminopimelate ligase